MKVFSCGELERKRETRLAWEGTCEGTVEIWLTTIHGLKRETGHENGQERKKGGGGQDPRAVRKGRGLGGGRTKDFESTEGGWKTYYGDRGKKDKKDRTKQYKFSKLGKTNLLEQRRRWEGGKKDRVAAEGGRGVQPGVQR